MLSFTGNITDVIKERHSVRTYKALSLTPELVDQIKQSFLDVTTPFSPKPRFKLIETVDFKNQSVKLGTYGIIKNSQYFVGVACEKSEFDLVSIGYAMEQLILYWTSLGLGTCWIGGTFNRTNFVKLMQVSDKEIFPAISPIGYEADKKRLIDSLISRHSHQRYEFSNIFFNQDFNHPLLESEAGEYLEILDNVRRAPSALNKQPWRIVKQGDVFHFYIDQDSQMKYLDIGIALCHFHLSILEKGLEGSFKVDNPKLETNYHYIISWV